MDKELKEFRQEVERVRRETPGRGYPAALRAFALRYAAQRQAAGVSLARVAEELGVSEPSLREWGKDVPPSLLHPVRLQAAPTPPRSSARSAGARAETPERAERAVPQTAPESVSGATPAATVSDPGAGAVTLVSPRGWRVEGLPAAAALRWLQEQG